MAKQEACELYIEQEIKEGLAQGKTPYSIGKDLSAWVEKLWETNIPQGTLERRARRVNAKIGTNVRIPPTVRNLSENQDNQVAEVTHGGKRESSGAPQKYKKDRPLPSDAMHFAIMAISQLERIMDDDPNRGKALRRVAHWIENQLKQEN
jgi:hypothetical protein